MKKILFFTLPFLGHINPNINAIIELNKKYDILCVSSKKYKDVFSYHGISMLEYPDCVDEYYGDGIISSDDDMEKKYYSSQYLKQDMSYVNKKSVELLEIIWFEIGNYIEDFNPTLILSDSYAFWGGPIANKLNINYINIESATDMLDKVQDKYFSQYITEVIAKEIQKELNPVEIIRDSNIINRQQQKKFEKFANSDNYKKPLATFAYMCKDFQIGADEMDSQYKYIGFDIDRNIIVEKENIIYISRGTINDSYNEIIIKKIIATFNDEKENRIVASCGVRADLLNKEVVNSNIEIFTLADQIEYLRKSKLFISHGGITGVREAVICETPIIIFPTTFHCYQVGLAIEKSGCGIILRKHPFDRCELEQAITKILDSEYYINNIRRLKSELINTKKNSDIYSFIEQSV